MSVDPEEPERQLDVRTIDGEPFGAIMTALADLPEGESLLLINSFEPAPLYQVLEEQGFSYETTNPAADVWHVEIERA